jgi:hypothetical protein
VGVTSIRQSSTATGLMVTAFAAGGLVDLVPALAVMLGANVGTTLIVQVEGLEPVADRVAQHPAELRAKGARNPGLHHVHAPNQERDCPAEIHERQSCIHPARSMSNAVRLSPYTLSPGDQHTAIRRQNEFATALISGLPELERAHLAIRHPTAG